MTRPIAAAAAMVAALAALFALAAPAGADGYVPVSGAGSTWSANAIDAWRRDVVQYGMRVDYAGTGSSDGRRQFLNGTVDFAASDIPFQFHPEDGSPPENPRTGYAYMPVTAGGTVFMYNLTINGRRVTNLRLSGENVAKIFTGVLTKWDDPAIAADNPGLSLPARDIVPIVRSDGSGSTAQFSMWLIAQHGGLWNDYCRRTGRTACGPTSYYPTVPGMQAKAGDLGVAGAVSQSTGEGSIGYVNYSYAVEDGFPVVKLLNAAGYYTEPTPENVAVSLLKAKINTDSSSPEYLTQQLGGVYTDTDARNYQLSSYSYLILPTEVAGSFSEAKGKTLGAFLYYAMCQGQQESPSLGYSPMPINLVQAGFDQIRRIPGVAVQDISIASCHNPTFSADGTNLLADHAPMPADCDKQGPVQCETGTGGARALSTPASKKAAAATGPASAAGPTAAAATAGGPSGSPSAAAGGGGTKATGRTAAAKGAAPGAGGPAAAAGCDADTGQCAGNTASSSPTAGEAAAEDVAAAPLTLTAHHGWGSTQTLMVIAAALLVILVVGPGLLAVVLDRRARR